MPTSEARIQANRMNAARSTGPKTEAGKERSRANSLKHGLTGEGVVLTPEDNAEVARLVRDFETEMRPSGSMGRMLLKRIAVLAVRMDRCVATEDAAINHRVRHAERRFDDDRLAEAEHLFAWIAAEPETHARRLRSTPEGIDRLIQGYEAVAHDLESADGKAFDYHHFGRLENMRGRTSESIPQTRLNALCRLVLGHQVKVELDEVAGMTRDEAFQHGRRELLALIRADIAELAALRETLDPDLIAQDRAEAKTRALFDPSPEAILARKYEAAAERGMFRTLKEFRQVEAEAAVRAVDATQATSSGRGTLASFFPNVGGAEFDTNPEESLPEFAGETVGAGSGMIGGVSLVGVDTQDRR